MSTDGGLAATALLAEDEPLLADALQRELARAWSALQVLDTVGNGAAAVESALALRPDVLFFDIKMPGLSGLDAAAELADRWDDAFAADGRKPFPLLVFVTAYDAYAVAAFETHAIDYLLKPVQPARLGKTVEKLKQALRQRRQTPAAAPSDDTLQRLQALLAAAPEPTAPREPPLSLLAVAVGDRVRMLPIDEVLCFEAADKYLRVLTVDREYLLRTPLKDLLPQLNQDVFWQVHRGTVVRAGAIEAVTRDSTGRFRLSLRGLSGTFAVSRVYQHLFKAM